MRVLVADDHPLFRDGICSLLEAAGFDVAGQAGDGAAAVEAALRLEPDIVLMDITMPTMDGLQALRILQQERPTLPVVMLTMSDDDENVLAAIKSGARGYLLKSLNADEFLAMLAGLQHGEAAISRQTTAALVRAVAATAAPRTGPQPPVESLTPRELELLQLVSRGMSNKTIAQALSVSENTVKYHLKGILQKLGAENRTEAVTSAISLGILDPNARVD